MISGQVRKTINIHKLIKFLDAKYDSDGALVNYDSGHGDGDTLAEFIVREIKDIVGYKQRLNSFDLGEIENALERAAGQLFDVFEECKNYKNKLEE